MTLEFENQEIDISGGDTDRLFNKNIEKWEYRGTNINDSVEKEVYGLKVPVIKWQDFMKYKEKIRRQTDIQDAMVIAKQNFI